MESSRPPSRTLIPDLLVEGAESNAARAEQRLDRRPGRLHILPRSSSGDDRMPRPVCLFTGQWADLTLEQLCKKAKSFGYDGLELACWGDHFDPHAALDDKEYVARKWQLLQDHGLLSFAISTHLVGQAVCDLIDARHKSILPAAVWGDGDPEGVRKRAAAEMILTAKAARRFFDAAPAPVKERLKQ